MNLKPSGRKAFRTARALLAGALLLLHASGHAGEEKLVNGLNGPAINWPNFLLIQDPYYGQITSAANYITTESALAESQVNVKLWYDNTEWQHFSTGWTVVVDYTIDLYDKDNNVTSNSQQLTIDYSPTGSYKDIALKRYGHGASSPYVYARLTVNSVNFKDDQLLPMSIPIPDDVHLDLEYIATRYHVLDETEYPNLQATVGTTTQGGQAENNVLDFTWNFQEGAESYDLEWLFVDAGAEDPHSGTFDKAFDWSNATRVSVKTNRYRIHLAYPPGMLIYRIRPVGRYAENGQYDRTKYGAWSYAPPASPAPTTQQAKTATTTFGNPVALVLDGLLPGMNWQYAVTYAEEGKHKEVISFFDGSLRSRQQVTLLNTDGHAVVGETVYDHEGRGAVTISPVPVPEQGMRYYRNDNGNAFNEGFDRTDFDRDTQQKSTMPGYTGPLAMPATSKANEFYSPANPLTTPFRNTIPDAEGYPYVQTTFKNDGTNRPIKQSGIGPVFTTEENDRHTRYFYGNTNRMELDRLFGTEVGYPAFYEKVKVRDPNGQVTVQYIDQAGRTVASAYAGTTPANLLDADARDTAQIITLNLLETSNDSTAAGDLASHYALSVNEVPTTFNFDYSLTPQSFCPDCIDPAQNQCADCAYDYVIEVRNEDGELVLDQLSNPAQYSATGVTDLSGASAITFTITFAIPGDYIVTKRLSLSEGSLAGYLVNFTNFINTNRQNNLVQTCALEKPETPEDCVIDCVTDCQEAYMGVDAQGATLYYDQDQQFGAVNGSGVFVNYGSTSPGHLQAIAACQATCEGDAVPQFDFCDLVTNAMKQQMGTGGQYFDNALVKFQTDPVTGLLALNNGAPVVDPAYYTSGGVSGTINNWLETNVWAASCATCFADANWLDANNQVITSWDDLRAAGVENYLETTFQTAYNGKSTLLEFHPEYCQMTYYCESTLACNPGGFTVNMADIQVFGNLMYHHNTDQFAEGNDPNFPHPYNLFNPFQEVASAPASGPLTDQTAYRPSSFTGNAFPDPIGGIDDNESIDCDVTLFTTDIQSWLENFYAFSVSGTTYVYNIWYVLWDPDNIAGTAPGALPQGVIDFFQQLHGDGTNPGLIGSGTGQISKYEFFRGIYLFYRDYALYDYFKTNSATYCGSVYTYWDGDQDLDAHIDNGGYTLVFPKNLLFENFDPNQLPYDPTGGGTNPLDLTALGSDLCEQNCEAYANSWLEQLQSCTGSLTAAELLALKNDLITICTYGCDASNNYTGDVNGDGSQYIDYNGNFAYTFADVIDEFTTGCAVTVVHPPVAPANNTCNCTQLQDEITNNSLAVDPLNPTPAELTAITNHLNTAFSTSYVEADVQGWLDYCDNEETGVMDANFIQALECAPCKCDRLQEFADERGLATDPANPTTGEITTITAELNLVYGTSFTATEVTAFFSTCNNATPEPAVLVGFPEGLRCIPTVDTYDPAVIALNDCNEEAVKIANANTALLYNRALQTAIGSWLADYRTACWSDMASREAFQTTYELNEYYYTLYYYDQAGNLTKTVPPRGVRFHTTDIEDPQNPGAFISNPVFGDITSERQNPTAGTAPNYENHTMITNYRYDSYGQLRHQYTPDGGASQFWYDAVGRLVVSQDARQAALGTPRYSYTLYDELGRITEVGEVATTDAMTDDIALGISQAFTDYQDWLDGAGTRYQVTRTFYDAVLLGAVDESLFFGPNGQQELRTRVASTTFTETILHAQLHLINNYDRALHYSYDIHGNVQTLVQEIPELLEFFIKPSGTNHAPEAFRTDYVYDLVSGNVNEVHYQKGEPDQFFHRYCYDADNRLTTVLTSTDYETWSKDAKYQYYAHGPMARTELGDQQVQGLDYAYTLQGWLKGVNSSTAVATRDLGKDGDGTATNDQHRVFGQDAMGFSLRYYDGDYTPIDAASGDFVASINPTGTYGVAAPSLYNGNISAMVTALHNLDEKPLPVHGNAYRYDQLNRIKQSNVFHNQSWTAQGGGTYTLTDGVANTNSFSLSTDNGDYAASYTYDRNGNLLALNRNTAGTIHDYNAPPVTGQQQIDQLTYTYDTEANNGIRVNRLNHAADATSGNGGLPQGQLQNNYTYDEIGNLTADVAEGIASIEWTVYGKIAKINRVPGNASPDLEFYYGPDGNRWLKVVKPKDQTGTLLNQDQWTYTYYVRDAQGNVLGVYEKAFEDRGNGDYTAWLRAKERNLYGSSRLGLLNHPVDISSREFTAGIDPTSKAFSNIAPGTSTIFDAPTDVFDRQVGLKRLELSNHLGNVLAVVSDRKLSQEDPGSPGTTEHYTSDVLAYNDYYPFGMLQPGRHASSSSYRFGFNGYENDDEVHGVGNAIEFGGRSIYDGRLGRFISIDPRWREFGWQSPYAYAANNPIFFLEQDGEGPLDFKKFLTKESDYFDGFVLGIADGLVSNAQIAGIISNPTGPQATQAVGQMYFTGQFILQIYNDEKAMATVKTNVSKAMGELYGDLTFKNGSGNAGYMHGFMILELLTGAATGGGSSSKTVINALKKGGEELVDLIRRVRIDRSYLNSGINLGAIKLAPKQGLPKLSLNTNLPMQIPGQGRIFVRYLVDIKDGLIRNGGRLADSDGKEVSWVIMNSGEVKFGLGHAYVSGHASTVKNAGSAVISKGKIVSISNGSGHYTPSPEHLDNAIETFRSMGILSDSHKVVKWVPKN